MGRTGVGEILLILAVAILLFAAGRISDIGKEVGEGVRNFKKGLRDDDSPPEPKPLPKEDAPEDEKKPA